MFSTPLSVLADDGVTVRCPSFEEIDHFNCHDENPCIRTINHSLTVDGRTIPLIWNSQPFSKETQVSRLSRVAHSMIIGDLVCIYDTEQGGEIRLRTSSLGGDHTCELKNTDDTHEFVNCFEDVKHE